MGVSAVTASELRSANHERQWEASRAGQQVSAARRLLPKLRQMGAQALRRMYVPSERVFVFRLRRPPRVQETCPLDGLSAEGRSNRYTAITLLGLAGEPSEVVATILGGHAPYDICDRLLVEVPQVGNLGDTALIYWAARVHGHSGADAAFDRMKRLFESARGFRTVELSWVVASLCEPGDGAAAHAALLERSVEALLSVWRPEPGVFPHDVGGDVPFARAHVACFADQVYPIQALARHYGATRSQRSLAAALRCAARICELQGPAGQWWWHYDARTGRVLEKYPVYYVHQDAMGPMALLDAWRARDGESGPIGGEFATAIERGFEWLCSAPELDGGSVVDDAAGVVWRKVARREPNKLSRQLQAGFSRLHSGLRAPALDWLFPPVSIDFETRPYQVGWLYYAWPPGRAAAWERGE